MSKKWHKTEVIRGSGKGKQLGFPTANLRRPKDFELKYGIYKVTVSLPSKSGSQAPQEGEAALPRRGREAIEGTSFAGRRSVYNGILYWGTRGDTGESLEIHIFDYNGDLYGQELQFNVGQFIREDRKFDSTAELLKQMQTDISTVKKLF